MNFRLLLHIALRSLGRNPRRTIVTGIGIGLGVAMCIAAYGVIDGMNGDLMGSVTRVEMGDIQVHAPEYLARRGLTLTIPDGAPAAAVAKAKGVAAVSARAYAWAFASRGEQSVGIQLMGFDPALERRVTTLDTKVTQGGFVPSEPTPWPASRALTQGEKSRDADLTREERDAAIAEIDSLGQPGSDEAKTAAQVRNETRQLVQELAPPPSRPPPIVLGAGLAKRLHAAVGDRIAVLAQDVNGSPADVDFDVVGLFSTGTSEVDSSRALVNLTDLQHFVALGQRVHEIAVRSEDGADAVGLAAKLGAMPAMQGLDVQAWSQLRPDVMAILTANDSLMQTLVGIVFCVAAIGVINTMLMAVFERRRELGVLKAVGMRPAHLLVIVVLEATTLAVAASLVGLGLGVGVDEYLAQHGLNLAGLFGDFSLAGVGFKPILHATITERGIEMPVEAMITMAILASLFPAYLAARVEPAVGMRDR